MITSLRYRLLAGASLSSAVVLGLLGIGVYVAMRHALMKEFDSTLPAEARLLSGMLEQKDEKISFEFDSQQMPDYTSRKSGRFFQIWREDGTILARSPSLGERMLQKISAPAGVVADVMLSDDDSGRALVLAAIPAQEEHNEHDGIKNRRER